MTIRKATAMNPPELTLRQASVADAPAIAELIAGLSHYFLATPDGAGAEGFLASLSPTHRMRLYELLFDTLRRHLCLESRYLDPVEQDRARTSASC